MPKRVEVTNGSGPVHEELNLILKAAQDNLAQKLNKTLLAPQLIEYRNIAIRPPKETVGSYFSKLGQIHAEAKGVDEFQMQKLIVGKIGHGVCLGAMLLLVSQPANPFLRLEGTNPLSNKYK